MFIYIFFRHLPSKNPLNFCKQRLEVVFLFSAKSRMISDSLRCRSDLKSAQIFTMDSPLQKIAETSQGVFTEAQETVVGDD